MIPEGWGEVALCELADVNPKRELARGTNAPYVEMAAVPEDGWRIRYFQSRIFDGGGAKFKNGDTILARITPCAENGKTAIVSECDAPVAFGSTELIVLGPRQGVSLTEFIYYAVKHHPTRALLISRMTGTSGRQRIPSTALAEARIPLPPLPEQRKIAAILTSVDEAIECTQAVIDQLGVVKKAMMAELLTRGIPGRHTKFKMTQIGELPEVWGTRTYGELAAQLPRSIQSGPFGSALLHEEFQDEGVFVVGIDNVQDGYFTSGAEHRIKAEKFAMLQKFELRPLDLLIVVTGASTGRVCVFPAGWETAILTKHVYRISVNPMLADVYFLLACLKYLPPVANRVQGVAQGLSRPGLNKELLLPTVFPLPSLDEQQRIAEAAAMLDRRITKEHETLDTQRDVKSALMSVLLTGEVQVQPDTVVV